MARSACAFVVSYRPFGELEPAPPRIVPMMVHTHAVAANALEEMGGSAAAHCFTMRVRNYVVEGGRGGSGGG